MVLVAFLCCETKLLAFQVFITVLQSNNALTLEEASSASQSTARAIIQRFHLCKTVPKFVFLLCWLLSTVSVQDLGTN